MTLTPTNTNPGNPTNNEAAAGIQRTVSREIYPTRHLPGDTGLPLLVVDNALGNAVIALQGAHVLSFQPAGQREMLWLSPKCVLAPGVAIRGGIPLCMPWFGPGPDGKSAHGFARTTPWTVALAERMADGATRLILELAGDETTCALWPHAFLFRLEVVVGKTLRLELTAQNRSASTAPYAFAFHTYFAVPDVAQVRVDGLENTTFIDKLDGFSRKTQQGEVTLAAATDRIHLDVPVRQTLTDTLGSFHIDSDCRCAIVWNAWQNDGNIADIGEGNHVGYLCVERGEVADRSLSFAPGQTHRASMTLSC